MLLVTFLVTFETWCIQTKRSDYSYQNSFSWGCAKQFCRQNKPHIEMQVSFSAGKTNISEHFNCSFVLQFASWNDSWVYEGKTRRKGWRISSRTWWSLQMGFLWQEWRSVQSVDFFSCHVTVLCDSALEIRGRRGRPRRQPPFWEIIYLGLSFFAFSCVLNDGLCVPGECFTSSGMHIYQSLLGNI